MATVKHAIREHDSVALREAVGKWPSGTEGTAVRDYGEVKLIEVADASGRTLDLLQVPESGLDLVGKHHR